MKKLILLSILFLLLPGCEKTSFEANPYLTARIVGFDMNCSACILEFPDDLSKVKDEIGQSLNNNYRSLNLTKGNYQTGQMLKVRIRKPIANELTPCISSYSKDDYKSIFVTDFKDFDNMILNDTVNLSYHYCLNDSENQTYICLDSVFNDSRCPSGLYCFWEGNATVRLKYQKYNSKPIIFDLNTYKGFKIDTIIERYKFSLLGLTPLPVAHQIIPQQDYRAKILIERK